MDRKTRKHMFCKIFFEEPQATKPGFLGEYLFEDFRSPIFFKDHLITEKRFFKDLYSTKWGYFFEIVLKESQATKTGFEFFLRFSQTFAPVFLIKKIFLWVPSDNHSQLFEDFFQDHQFIKRGFFMDYFLKALETSTFFFSVKDH